jgi:hypothetical protein
MMVLVDCSQLTIDMLQLTYMEINNKRYFMERKPYRTSLSTQIFDRDLQDDDNDDGSPPWLQDEEFLQKYRMHHKNFHKLLAMIIDHPVFKTNYNKQQAPVAHQLLLFLFYLGKSGSGANNPTFCNMFHLGWGAGDNYKRRCIKAIRSLQDNVIVWPDRQER